jgi:hypothetical protein
VLGFDTAFRRTLKTKPEEITMSSVSVTEKSFDVTSIMRRLDAANTKIVEVLFPLTPSILEWITIARSYAHDFLNGNEHAIEQVDEALKEAGF